jgi:hypothetical protein
LGDRGSGLVGGDGAAVGVGDDVGHAATHDHPGALGEVGGDDAEGAEVAFASFDHLHPVDAGELGFLLAGGVGGLGRTTSHHLASGVGRRLAGAGGALAGQVCARPFG